MAKNLGRSIFKTSILILTVILSIAFLHVCLVPYISSAKFWWVGFAGLVAPFLIVLLIFTIVFWLYAKPKWALMPILVLALGYKQIDAVFAYHFKATFNPEKLENTLRIVDWNVQSFNGLSNNKQVKKLVPNDIAESIKRLNADVLCLQEFNHSKTEAGNNIGLFKELYPYYYFSKDYKRSASGYFSGCIIFSKFKIIDTGKISYPKAESLIFADILKGKDTIRIYTTHLQSFKFKKNDYDNIDKIKEQEEDALNASKNVFNKMKPAFKRRADQAEIVHAAITRAPYPTIVCGDFNDVPNSYTYFTIKGNMQDAFLKKGFGIGRTFISIAPTLRIDYILADKQFEILQFDMVDEGLSDHIMLVADLKLKSK
jgi:endonuclease/exonuclease/phosphatase family metal-dependent hydrolase